MGNEVKGNPTITIYLGTDQTKKMFHWCERLWLPEPFRQGFHFAVISVMVTAVCVDVL